MIRRIHLAFAALLLAGTLACTAVAQPAGPPYPPVPGLRAEPPPPPPPGPHYVWQPGHWRWDGRGYVWISGRYLPAHAGWHHYVHGHWAQRGPGWVWVPAHWT